MRNEKLYAVIRAAFFAALDYVFAMFQIHVPSPVGHPFVDLGFTFVALGTMFLGFKYGFISGAVGLGVFDLLNGYANHAYDRHGSPFADGGRCGFLQAAEQK